MAAAIRRCATGRQPDAPMLVPGFTSQYHNGDGIREVAEAMIETFQELSWLKEGIDKGEYSIWYVWKGKGGESKGRPTLGSTSKGSGKIAYLTDATWVIEMAADHCSGLDNYGFEAALYHQLCHCVEREVEPSEADQFSKNVPSLRNHDAELFHDEIVRFGVWNTELIAAERTFAKQLKIDFAGTEPPKRGRREPTPIVVPDPTAEEWSEAAVETLRANDAIMDGQDLVADPDSPVKTPIPFEQTSKGRAAKRQAADDAQFDSQAAES